MIRELLTGVVAGGEGVGAEDGEVLALALERGEPAARAEGLAGAEQRPVELVHRRLVVLRVNHPRDLAAQDEGSVTFARGATMRAVTYGRRSLSFPAGHGRTCRRDRAVMAVGR